MSAKQSDKIDGFWLWFKTHKTDFEHLNESNRDKKLDQILEHLKPIAEGLAVEVSDEFKGIRDIRISANGDGNNFAAVKAIVNKAPTIKGWTATAFRQRTNEDFTIKYQDLSFTPSKMYFSPTVKKDGLDLIIYVKGIKNHNADQVSYYGLIVMDNVLGEYDSVTKVHQYSFVDLADATQKQQLKPLKELPGFIDSFYKTK